MDRKEIDELFSLYEKKQKNDLVVMVFVAVLLFLALIFLIFG